MSWGWIDKENECGVCVYIKVDKANRKQAIEGGVGWVQKV